MGGLIGGRYELKYVVGTGGMSSVYCAYDTLLERNVAIKLLHEQYGEDDDYVERFRREARAVAQLSHPNIVTVIDRGEVDGRQFIVFEFVDGETLKDVVDREGPLPVRRALELGLEVGRALAFAHEQGLVHRDVKPQNVILNGDGLAKVTDFGIVRSLNTASHTETGTVLGTSHYIAPEQARGERVDVQTDVYSFGVLLFELLAGEVPYEGESFLAIAMRHVNDPVPSLLERRPDCPLRLAALVEECMAKQPAERPESMADVVVELEACLAQLDARPDGEPTMIVRPPLVKRRRPRPGGAQRRRRGLAPMLLVVLALLALTAAATVFLLRGGDLKEATGGSGGRAVDLAGVASYDPFGDDKTEHPELVGHATDGNASTYWTTSTYQAFTATKEGVGLVLDAGKRVELSSVTVVTDTPGFTAEIRAGNAQGGPFEQVVGASRTVGPRTTWELEGASTRFYVVWITALDSRARISEVTAS
ncbi:MAG: protein kinase [Actinomycetota bacterium]|nr:protein kinase [Actinomycetota bacterium]